LRYCSCPKINVALYILRNETYQKFWVNLILSQRLFLQENLSLPVLLRDLPYSNYVYLSAGAKLDLDWWFRFLPHYNGVSLLFDDDWSGDAVLHIFTDAFGFGAGALFGNHWFSFPWPHDLQCQNIVTLELFAIVLSCQTWGHLWKGKLVMFHCDNQSVTYAIQKRRVHNHDLMLWIRELHFLEAKFGFLLNCSHISGQHNIYADALSRGQIAKFFADFFTQFSVTRDVHPSFVSNPELILFE